ncbi:hypothetical protein V2G26_001603 [Clonostachys chloroleuca]
MGRNTGPSAEGCSRRRDLRNWSTAESDSGLIPGNRVTKRRVLSLCRGWLWDLILDPFGSGWDASNECREQRKSMAGRDRRCMILEAERSRQASYQAFRHLPDRAILQPVLTLVSSDSYPCLIDLVAWWPGVLIYPASFSLSTKPRPRPMSLTRTSSLNAPNLTHLPRCPIQRR